MAVLSKSIDIYTTKYDNLLFLGDFNAGLENASRKLIAQLIDASMKNKPTCYKNHEKPSCIDLILTNCPCSFQNSCVIQTGLSDFHKMVATVMKGTLGKSKLSTSITTFFTMILSGSFYKISFHRICKVIMMTKNFSVSCKNVLDKIAP